MQKSAVWYRIQPAGSIDKHLVIVFSIVKSYFKVNVIQTKLSSCLEVTPWVQSVVAKSFKNSL